jgi:hypothetical protein
MIDAEMGGRTFSPGVYTHGSALNIALANPVVYLDAAGDPDAVFIFVATSTLTTSAGSEIVLQNGAKAENVFWVLGTALTMGADSILVGNVLAGTAITIGTNGKIMGRAIAQTAVTCETHCTVKAPTKARTRSFTLEDLKTQVGRYLDMGQVAWAKSKECYGKRCDGYYG